ncbi:MAG: Holliday junction resolvase RuvX [Bacillota bacterium]|jgi:putative Holliday junction resolvase
MTVTEAGRILALDIGERRIGLAVSDELGLMAHGAGVYQRKELSVDVEWLIKKARDLGCTQFVIGLPRNMNGTLGPRAELTQEFGAKLTENSGLPVKYWDERLTTVEAEKILIDADVSRKRRKLVIDQNAAILILQGYLASLKSGRV